MKLTTTSNPGTLWRARRIAIKTALLSLPLFCLTNQVARAGSATWTGALSSNWNDDRNWNPQTVPDGPDDIATFAVSDQTAVGFGLEINSIVFAQDASSYAFDLEGVPDFTGGGIINNSSNLQSFEIGWVSYYINGYPYSISFYNSATAGELTQFTIKQLRGKMNSAVS